MNSTVLCFAYTIYTVLYYIMLASNNVFVILLLLLPWPSAPALWLVLYSAYSREYYSIHLLYFEELSLGTCSEIFNNCSYFPIPFTPMNLK